MKAVAILAGALALTACGSAQESGRLVDFTVEPVTVVAVNHPKHFSVDLRDNSGVVWRKAVRSKHCTGSRTRVVVGRTLPVPLQIVERNGVRERRIAEGQLQQLVCPQ